MSFPRPRLTVRRLMIAVAVVAMSLWSDGVRRRREDYLLHESHHAELVVKLTHLISCEGYSGVGQEEVAQFRRWRTYDTLMARRYHLAARFPFFPINPDPPRPE